MRYMDFLQVMRVGLAVHTSAMVAVMVATEAVAIRQVMTVVEAEALAVILVLAVLAVMLLCQPIKRLQMVHRGQAELEVAVAGVVPAITKKAAEAEVA
jgi:hypothetical protein